ncbi:MAG: hypothetical protein K9J13_10660 [Saprospiraceae bacterium]|nr:hypothetical protein [Saprospiraceae bacterium]
MEELTRREFTITYTDACPSELLHNSSEKYLCIGMVNYFNIDRLSLINISQFKKIRGIERKLKNQQYIIERIENDSIALTGLINWNYRKQALENGKLFLEQANIIPIDNDYSKSVCIDKEILSYGHAVSLSWYSIVLATFLKQIGAFAKWENKENAILLIDLLPGDNIDIRRNLNVVRYITNNSELKEFQYDAIKNYNLSKIGYGYGIKDGSTKSLKNDFEYTIIDWIVQSFNSLIKFEKEKLEKSSSEFQMSELARYLIDKGNFKISDAIGLI